MQPVTGARQRLDATGYTFLCNWLSCVENVEIFASMLCNWLPRILRKHYKPNDITLTQERMNYMFNIVGNITNLIGMFMLEYD